MFNSHILIKKEICYIIRDITCQNFFPIRCILNYLPNWDWRSYFCIFGSVFKQRARDNKEVVRGHLSNTWTEYIIAYLRYELTRVIEMFSDATCISLINVYAHDLSTFQNSRYGLINRSSLINALCMTLRTDECAISLCNHPASHKF